MPHRYFIKISFNGTHYHGWQVQKNSANTVQQKINDGLSKLLSEKIETQGCCRTDAGVHAKELYAHFDSSKSNLHLSSLAGRNWSAERRTPSLCAEKSRPTWLHKFNSMLPADISIDGIFSVGDNANARFDATARTYQYHIHSKRNPFLVNRSYYYYSKLDIALMNKAAKILMKHEDFSSFSKAHTQANTNKCKIFEAEWMPPQPPEGGILRDTLSVFPPSGGGGAVLVFTIRADRFLRGMVRMIVGTMMLVGRHKIKLNDFQKIMDSKDCRNSGALVPACGLYLMKVEYPKKIFSPDPKERK